MKSAQEKKKEIYTYRAPWTIYGMNWSVRSDQPFRLAVGSFKEEYANKVHVVQLNDNIHEFEVKHEFEHPYPTTKIMWHPSTNTNHRDLIATTGDYLRLWSVSDHGVSMDCCLSNNKASEFCAPLTSFDWNENDPTLLGTSSIDTTCTMWDIEKQQTKTQLIAHDKEVYDIAFSESPNVFASVGNDGSVRMFDLRSLEQSTILYESQDLIPLLRLAWNKKDPNYIATIGMDSSKVVILDIRVPSLPVSELSGHNAAVNSIAWAPHSSCHICTAGDDNQALIWDLSSLPKPIEDPILAYNASAEVNQLQWSSRDPDWVAIGFDNNLQILRI